MTNHATSPLQEPGRTPERARRTQRRLAADLHEALGSHDLHPEREIQFWQRAARLLAPRPWMAELRANFALFVCLLITSYVGWCVWDRFANDLPSTVNYAVAVNREVPRGGLLYVRTSLMRHRVCERDFEWLIQDSQGNRERFREPHMHGIGNPGPDVFVNKYRIPSDLEPGPATLRFIWSWSCPSNLWELVYPLTLVVHDIPFTILPSSDAPATPRGGGDVLRTEPQRVPRQPD